MGYARAEGRDPDWNITPDPADRDHQDIPDVPGDLFAERLARLQDMVRALREEKRQLDARTVSLQRALLEERMRPTAETFETWYDGPVVVCQMTVEGAPVQTLYLRRRGFSAGVVFPQDCGAYNLLHSEGDE